MTPWTRGHRASVIQAPTSDSSLCFSAASHHFLSRELSEPLTSCPEHSPLEVTVSSVCVCVLDGCSLPLSPGLWNNAACLLIKHILVAVL